MLLCMLLFGCYISNHLIIFLHEDNTNPGPTPSSFSASKILLRIPGRSPIFRGKRGWEQPRWRLWQTGAGVDRCAKTAIFFLFMVWINCINGAKACNKAQTSVHCLCSCQAGGSCLFQIRQINKYIRQNLPKQCVLGHAVTIMSSCNVP